jgi:tyrosinase
MLILLEFQLQRVLGDQDFGLPYWDWAADGELAPADQPGSPLWGDACLGGDGDPVTTGPFAFAEGDPKGWRVLLDVDVQGELRPVDRGLRRSFARAAPTLPAKAQVAAALAIDTYDAEPWGTTSAALRNRLEGWRPAGAAPGLHNRVHVWVGGDMLPASSPNDPVFYLNHANVDRVWAAWQAGPTAGPYLPGPDAPAELRGHRLDDEVFSLLTDPVTPRQMLDVASFYTYDTLVVS